MGYDILPLHKIGNAVLLSLLHVRLELLRVKGAVRHGMVYRYRYGTRLLHNGLWRIGLSPCAFALRRNVPVVLIRTFYHRIENFAFHECDALRLHGIRRNHRLRLFEKCSQRLQFCRGIQFRPDAQLARYHIRHADCSINTRAEHLLHPFALDLLEELRHRFRRRTEHKAVVLLQQRVDIDMSVPRDPREHIPVEQSVHCTLACVGAVRPSYHRSHAVVETGHCTRRDGRHIRNIKVKAGELAAVAVHLHLSYVPEPRLHLLVVLLCASRTHPSAVVAYRHVNIVRHLAVRHVPIRAVRHLRNIPLDALAFQTLGNIDGVVPYLLV